MSHYDIAIIGAGPSGSALAKLIPSNLKTVIIDKRDLFITSQKFIEPKFNSKNLKIDDFDSKNSVYDSDFNKKILFNRSKIEKSCGGLLAFDAQKILKKLDLKIPSFVIDSNQLFSIHAIDLESKNESVYPKNYINIDRDSFDRWLFSLIPDYVDKKMGYFLDKIEKTDNIIKFSLLKDGKYEFHTSKFLVGADGALSKVRKYLNPKNTPPLYLTVQDYFEKDFNLQHFVAFFHSKLTDFYGWIIPKESHNIVGLSFRQNSKKRDIFFKSIDLRMEFLKKEISKYYPSFNKEKYFRSGGVHFRPEYVDEIFLGRDNIFLVGEAAGWISPSSAEGISFAIETAILLSESFRNLNSVLSDYKKKTLHIKKRLLFKILKSPFLYSKNIRNMIFSTNIGQI